MIFFVNETELFCLCFILLWLFRFLRLFWFFDFFWLFRLYWLYWLFGFLRFFWLLNNIRKFTFISSSIKTVLPSGIETVTLRTFTSQRSVALIVSDRVNEHFSVIVFPQNESVSRFHVNHSHIAESRFRCFDELRCLNCELTDFCIYRNNQKLIGNRHGMHSAQQANLLKNYIVFHK